MLTGVSQEFVFKGIKVYIIDDKYVINHRDFSLSYEERMRDVNYPQSIDINYWDLAKHIRENIAELGFKRLKGQEPGYYYIKTDNIISVLNRLIELRNKYNKYHINDYSTL